MRSFLFANNGVGGGRTKTQTQKQHAWNQKKKISAIMFTNIAIAIYYALDSVEFDRISKWIRIFHSPNKFIDISLSSEIICFKIFLTSNWVFLLSQDRIVWIVQLPFPLLAVSLCVVESNLQNFKDKHLFTNVQHTDTHARTPKWNPLALQRPIQLNTDRKKKHKIHKITNQYTPWVLLFCFLRVLFQYVDCLTGLGLVSLSLFLFPIIYLRFMDFAVS